MLLKTYKEQLPALGGPITNGSVINMDRLKRMLTKLAEDEEDAFKRLLVRSLITLFGLITYSRHQGESQVTVLAECRTVTCDLA